MLTNDNYTLLQSPNHAAPEAVDIAEYIRGIAGDLERMSQKVGLDGVSACLRAVVAEARRAKNDDRLLKLGVTPDRRLG